MSQFKSRLRDILDSTFNKNDTPAVTTNAFHTIDYSSSKESKARTVTSWNYDFSLENYKKKNLNNTRNPLDQISSYSEFYTSANSKGKRKDSNEFKISLPGNNFKTETIRKSTSNANLKKNESYSKETNFSFGCSLNNPSNNKGVLTSSRNNKINREIEQFRNSLRQSTVKNSTIRPFIEVEPDTRFNLNCSRGNSRVSTLPESTSMKNGTKSHLTQAKDKSFIFPISLRKNNDDDYATGFLGENQTQSYLEKYSPQRKR